MWDIRRQIFLHLNNLHFPEEIQIQFINQIQFISQIHEMAQQ